MSPEHLAEAALQGEGLSAVARPAVDVAPVATVAPGWEQSPLIGRERDVAALIARGLTNRQIAAELMISEQTAGTHVGNILGKLGLATRAQVAIWAIEQGLPRHQPL
jgi:DNA-binding NarL/FixJ family response regulator